MGAELSFARVRRPTDNALTERFYGTIKQEEIYLVGNYPDEISAREEIGRYIEHYHHHRPHQALMNFTPARVHDLNNKSRLLAELKELKRKTRERRKEFWMKRSELVQGLDLGVSLGMGRFEIVDPGANTAPFFNSNHRILRPRVLQQETTHLSSPFCLTEKKLDITLDDKVRIHNAFPDRGFKP